MPHSCNAGYTTTSGPTHYGARYYTPASSTWTQTDPNPATIAQPLQYDRYPYTGDNPVSLSDPTGRDWLGSLIGGIDFTLEAAGAFGVGVLGLGAAITLAPETGGLSLLSIPLIGGAFAGAGALGYAAYNDFSDV